MRWKLQVAEKRLRGKLGAGLGTCGLEQEMEVHAVMKIYAKNLLNDTADAMGLQGGVAKQRGVWLCCGRGGRATARHDGAESG